MSSDTQPSKTLIVALLLVLVLGAALQVNWLKVIGAVGLVCLYIDYSVLPALKKRWYELLDAIRGKRQDGAESASSEEGVHTGTISREGILWPVPREPTPEELERARVALQKREAERYAALAAREREAALEQERTKHGDEKREQEAREFLVRESERVQKEREEREAAEKREREAEANRTRWIH